MSSWCQLSILTDEVSQELPAVVRFAREFGLEGIELRSLHGRAFKDLTPVEIREVRRQCDEAGLKVSGVATPVFKCELDDPAQIAEHREIFRRSLEAAEILGCRIVRVFTFLRRGHPSSAADLERAAAEFPVLIELARAAGRTVGVENEASCLVGSGPEMGLFLSHLPVSAHLGIVWDPCNSLYLDGTADPVHEEYPALGARVVHVHAKDARRQQGRAAQACVELGTGEIDFPAQLAALKRSGYGGWITLETHWRGATALDAESQHLPAGHAFSAGAEAASRICLGHLRRMVLAT
jgi:sugar phosphate isomerase/epimerase